MRRVARGREPLPELVRVDRVLHLRFAQMPQQVQAPGLFPAALRVVDAVDRFLRRDAQPVDDAEPAEHQRVEVARFDERELVQRDGPAREQHLAQRAPLPRRLVPQRGERVRIDQPERAEQFAELPVAGFEFF